MVYSVGFFDRQARSSGKEHSSAMVEIILKTTHYQPVLQLKGFGQSNNFKTIFQVTDLLVLMDFQENTTQERNSCYVETFPKVVNKGRLILL